VIEPCDINHELASVQWGCENNEWRTGTETGGLGGIAAAPAPEASDESS